MKWTALQHRIKKAIEDKKSPFFGYDFSEALSILVRERFIARAASSSIKENIILKGGLLLTTVYAKASRFTIDADLNYSGKNDLQTLRGVIDAICSVDLGDGFSFSRNEGVVIDHEKRLYAGAQFKISTTFVDRQRLSFTLDFGVGDIVEPVLAMLPVLEDTQFSSMEIQVYPPETIAAEKLSTCIDLGRQSSRMKDYFDLFVLRDHVDIKKFEKAAQKTFEARGVPFPGSLPDLKEDVEIMQPGWNRFLTSRGLRVIKEVPKEFEDILSAIREYYGTKNPNSKE